MNPAARRLHPESAPHHVAGLPAGIQTIAEVSPVFAELSAKAAEISREISSLNNQRQQLLVLSREARQKGTGRSDGAPTEQDIRVAAILGDVVPSATREVTLSEAIQKIDDRVADLSTAVSILNERIVPERMKASAVVCEQVRPHYEAIVAEVVDKMIEAALAAAKYRAFAQAMNEREVAWSGLNPLGPHIGGITVKSSPFGLWLQEAIRRGFGDASRLPQSLR